MSCLKIHNKLFIVKALMRIYVFSILFTILNIPLFFHKLFHVFLLAPVIILFKIIYRKLRMWTPILLSKIFNKHFANHFTTAIYFLKIFQNLGIYVFGAWYIYFYKAIFLMCELQREVLCPLVCDF